MYINILGFTGPSQMLMYEIVTYIYPKNCPDVAEYSTRGASKHVCVHDHPSGKKVDFTHTYPIVSSNLGTGCSRL